MAPGVIINTDGFSLMNNYVVAREKFIRVLLTDQRRMRAEVIGTDPETDLAV